MAPSALREDGPGTLVQKAHGRIVESRALNVHGARDMMKADRAVHPTEDNDVKIDWSD